MRPLTRMQRTMADVPAALRERLEELSLTADRLTVQEGSDLFEAVAQHTGCGDLGVRTALFCEPADFEVVEWVATSAPTWRAACETVCRYVRILNEAAQFRVEVVQDKAHVILGTSVPLCRAASDFQLAAFHFAFQRWLPGELPELAVWLKHDPPIEVETYRNIFGDRSLLFRAAFDGFVFDAQHLDQPLPTANPERHLITRDHVEQLLQGIAPADGIVARTSRAIIQNLADGYLAERTAGRLHMARRTLVRKLAQQGTSFSELVKEARYRMALHYLQNTHHSVEDLAFLLGYSECAAFVRAFKRWNGRTPFEYRRSYLQAARAPRAARRVRANSP